MKDIDIVKDQLNKAKELLKELPVEQGELIHDYVDYALRVVKKHGFIDDVISISCKKCSDRGIVEDYYR